MPSSWTVLILLHAVAASYSLIFGAVNLLRRAKGGRVHRIVGRIWKRNIRAHRSFMTGSYFGLIGAFVGVLAVPSRRIPQLAIHEFPLLGLLILVLLSTAALTVAGIAQLHKAETAPTA